MNTSCRRAISRPFFSLAICTSFIATQALAAPTTSPAIPSQPGAVADNAYITFRPAGYFPNQPAPENPEKISQQLSCLIQIDALSDASSAMTGTYAYPYGGLQYNGSQDAICASSIATSTVILDALGGSIHLTPDQRRTLLGVTATPTGARLLLVDIVLRKGDVSYSPDAVNTVLTSLTDLIKAAFDQSADAARKAADVRRATAEATIADLQKQLADVRTKLSAAREETSGVVNQYGDGFQAISNIRLQRQNVLSELERSRTRLKTLVPVTAGSLVTEWEAIVKQQQQRLDELKLEQKDEKATATDVTAQEAKLNEAENHLLAARQMPDTSDGANRGYRLQEMATLKANIAEQESRVKQFDDTLAKLEDPKYQTAMDQIPDLQQQEQSLHQQLNELRARQSILSPPSAPGPSVQLTVLGAPAAK